MKSASWTFTQIEFRFSNCHFSQNGGRLSSRAPFYLYFHQNLNFVSLSFLLHPLWYIYSWHFFFFFKQLLLYLIISFPPQRETTQKKFFPFLFFFFSPLLPKKNWNKIQILLNLISPFFSGSHSSNPNSVFVAVF